MYAIHVLNDEPDRPLVWQETDDPEIGPEEVLVDVYATALNRADLSQRAGNYPPPPGASEILGLEMAGVIRAIGQAVQAWQVGDRVCALLSGGGYAEQVAVPQALLMPVPPEWSLEEAAGLPEVYLTAFVNLFMEAHLRPGERALVHGGASGVGTAAIQILHGLGHSVIVTAGTDEKVARCRELGADLAINYRTTDFVKAIQEYTNGEGVDVVLDMVGADYYARNIEVLKTQGRLVFISTLGGSTTEINIGQLMGKRIHLIGSVLRARSLDEKSDIRSQFISRCWTLIEQGHLRPIIDSIVPIEQANKAHERMRQNLNIGKIIMRVRD